MKQGKNVEIKFRCNSDEKKNLVNLAHYTEETESEVLRQLINLAWHQMSTEMATRMFDDEPGGKFKLSLVAGKGNTETFLRVVLMITEFLTEQGRQDLAEAMMEAILNPAVRFETKSRVEVTLKNYAKTNNAQ